MTSLPTTTPLLLFDGVCNLCNDTVQFCINNDPNGNIYYASLQSTIGQAFLKKHQLDTKNFSSVILIEGNQYYTQSDAPLRLTKYFKHPLWRLVNVFFIVPKFIRDAVYDFFAKNRYKWFGQKDACMLPTPELRGRFLD